MRLALGIGPMKDTTQRVGSVLSQALDFPCYFAIGKLKHLCASTATVCLCICCNFFKSFYMLYISITGVGAINYM